MTDIHDSPDTNESIPPQGKESLDIPLASINSVALARLVEEVRSDDEGESHSINAYNRTYHRHNR